MSWIFDVSSLNSVLGLGTLALQISTLGGLALFCMREREEFRTLSRFLSRNGLLIATLLSGAGIFLTLWYSEVLNLPPCPLCWYQRIFLYPQMLLLGVAWWRSDSRIADYSILLSLFGFGFALYHHLLQTWLEGTLPCPATGVSCAQRIMFEFGYITYPMMAITLFVTLITIMLFVREGKRN